MVVRRCLLRERGGARAACSLLCNTIDARVLPTSRTLLDLLLARTQVSAALRRHERRSTGNTVRNNWSTDSRTFVSIFIRDCAIHWWAGQYQLQRNRLVGQFLATGAIDRYRGISRWRWCVGWNAKPAARSLTHGRAVDNSHKQSHANVD